MIATMLPALYAPLEGASMSFSPSSFDLIENDKSRNPKELCPHAVRGSRGSCVTSSCWSTTTSCPLSLGFGC